MFCFINSSALLHQCLADLKTHSMLLNNCVQSIHFIYVAKYYKLVLIYAAKLCEELAWLQRGFLIISALHFSAYAWQTLQGTRFCHPHDPTRPLHVNRGHTADSQRNILFWKTLRDRLQPADSTPNNNYTNVPQSSSWSPCHFPLCDFRLGRDCGNKNERKNQLFLVIAILPCGLVVVCFAVSWVVLPESEDSPRILFREPRMLTTCNGGIISDAVFINSIVPQARHVPLLGESAGRTSIDSVSSARLGFRGTRPVLVLLDQRRSMATACT